MPKPHLSKINIEDVFPEKGRFDDKDIPTTHKGGYLRRGHMPVFRRYNSTPQV